MMAVLLYTGFSIIQQKYLNKDFGNRAEIKNQIIHTK